MSHVDYTRERTLVESLVWNLDPEAQERWGTCRSSHRFLSFIGKQLYVFTLDANNKPTVKNLLTMEGINLSDSNGLVSKWRSANGELLSVGHTPMEIAPSVFLWHTFSSDLQYVPHKGVFNVKTSMLFKAEHHIGYKHVGPHYILEASAFKQEFAL